MHKYATYAVIGALAAAIVIGLVLTFSTAKNTVPPGYEVKLEEFSNSAPQSLPSLTLPPPP